MNFQKRAIFLIGCICISSSILWHSNYAYSKTEFQKAIKQCAPLTQRNMALIEYLVFSSCTVSNAERSKLGLKDLAIASTTSLDHIGEAIRSCDTFQQHPQLKNVPFLMYFIGEIPQVIQDLYAQLCPVAEIVILDRKNYSLFLNDLSHFKFKALYQTLTLQKYKLVLGVDTSIRFPKRLDFNKLISEAIKRNPLDVTLLSSAKHAAFPVIHPDMYHCFSAINPIEMQNMQQFQGGLVLWIGSANGRTILKKLLECSLKPNCLAPPGAQLHCDYAKIYSDNRTFSGCHRFDQAAINLILYQESRFQPNLFQWDHPDFIIEKSPKLLV